MTAKRAFTSFDFDYDEDLRNLLVGQAENPRSPFAIVDASVRYHLRGDWKKKVRNRIRRADLVIVMCGEHTHEAAGVAAEVKIAQEEGKPYFLLNGRRDGVCTKPTTALESDEIHEWTWDNLRKLIEGKTLTEVAAEWLVSTAPLIIAGAGLALWIRSRKAKPPLARPRRRLATPYARPWAGGSRFR